VTDDERDSPGVVAPPLLIHLGPLVLGLLPYGRLPVPFLPRKMTRDLRWPLLGSGVLLMNWFLWTLRSAGTPVKPEKPVSSLVTDGPFRYARNPSYLSMVMTYTGKPASPTRFGPSSFCRRRW
jgi:protein-S-isoprenylcysteine O-methyltransferase Ste14